MTERTPRPGREAGGHLTGFDAAADRLRVPGMGTEAVAPLLADLVRLTRPRRVLEVGMGYTTAFLAAALRETEDRAREEAVALAAKTRSHLASGSPLDDAWLTAEPPLAAPASHLEPYRPELVAVDDLSNAASSARRVGDVLADLGLADRVTIVDATLRECRDRLPPGFAPIDLAWVDAWDCLYFIDHFLDLINPDGGLLVLHYLMTYPEGEAILRYLAGLQRARPGELEILNLLEPHKLAQNSVTVVRRAGGRRPAHTGAGGRVRYDGGLHAAAVAQMEQTPAE
ncbi:class I SAM-dependent methyltransferase [Actinoallomurus acaciae]|uniref:Class I SAM-dependent methyltransferase n=1 Tax=Actinoallomurus acaciae TaxID=502577 RepID=A0ABV5YWX5_9ACTN